MPDFGASHMELINDLIARGRPVVAKMGTVSARDSTGARVLVAFDGSAGVAQPVKCYESVIVEGGDRVGMVRFESDWIIVGNYSLRTLGSNQTDFVWASSANSTSTSYVDMPTSPSLSFSKVRDSTQIRIRVLLSMYTTVAGSRQMIGLRVTSEGAVVDYDQDVVSFLFNAANTHTAFGGSRTTSGTMPAGQYTMTARWYRITGTGLMTVDTADHISIEAEEVII